MKLILFDIDGTLVLTGGAGGRAMSRAFTDVFGADGGWDGLSLAGRTDFWIVAETASRHGIPFDARMLPPFRSAYLVHLAREMQQPGPRKGVMPGVRALLDALQGRDDVYLALLTGNFEAGARVKLEYFDLWRYFQCGAFGDEALERTVLLAEALDRVAAAGGPSPPPADVVIVGDTPLDVAAAAAGGVRSVAVATGNYDVEALAGSGADVVLTDLTDLAAVLDAFGLADERETDEEANGARWPSRSSKSAAPR